MSEVWSSIPEICPSCETGRIKNRECLQCGNVFGTSRERRSKTERRKNQNFSPSFSRGEIDRLRRKEDAHGR